LDFTFLLLRQVNVHFSIPYLYRTSSTMQRPTWLGLGLWLVVRVGRCMVLDVWYKDRVTV